MQRRITVLATVAALVAVVLFAVPLGVLAAHRYVDDERLRLQQAAVTAAATIPRDLVTGAALPTMRPGVTLSVYDDRARLTAGPSSSSSGSGASGAGASGAGASGSASVSRLVAEALLGHVTSVTGGGRISVAAPVADGDQVTGAVVVATDLGPAHRRTATTALGLAALGLVVVGVVGASARILARRLSRPVEELTRSARRIGQGDLSVRAPRCGVPELDTLAETLNTSTAEIEAMVLRERRLSTEVSHQLRTPLAGLRLELDALRRSAPAGVAAGLDPALAAVERLQTTIADVIGLARDLPASPATPVAALFDHLRQRWQPALAAGGRRLVLRAAPGMPDLPLSPAAARQTLDVLVDNAVRHGAGAVTVDARVAPSADGPLGAPGAGDIVIVDVSDEGPALTAEPHLLFSRGGPEEAATHSGIGLPFARRVAEAEGAYLTLADASPPTFRLTAALRAPAAGSAGATSVAGVGASARAGAGAGVSARAGAGAG